MSIAVTGPARPALAALTVLLISIAIVAAAAAPAHAGTWMQVSCINPDGSAAPSEGWSGQTGGPADDAGEIKTQCGPGSPLDAGFGTATAAPNDTSELLVYTPPAGSTLDGGEVYFQLDANGYGNGAFTGAGLYAGAFSTTDNFFACAYGFISCPPSSSGSWTYAGQIAVPPDSGGDFLAGVGCNGATASDICDEGGIPGYWALAEIIWARMLLSTGAAPQGSGFSGSALQRGVRGTAHLVFTATDPGGPGVYEVLVALDGRTVWAGTPDTNDGECVPVGTDTASGALMFDHQQPCPATEVADVPVPTTGVPDGAHELAVTVVDAAQDRSTVFDQTITTSNPQTTPTPHGARSIHARFVISWHWAGSTTWLRSIEVNRLPRAAGVTVACTGRHCPRLTVGHVNAPQVRELLSSLDGRRFHAGDDLSIQVSERHHRPERIQLTFRRAREPRARLLK
jgi:hypothetical protein